MVNYEEAIKKPFTDVKKLILGIVLSIIPIVNFTVVTGFAIESSGLGKAKPSKQMPEWKNWWYLFVKGLGALVIKIVYVIPGVAVILVAVGIVASNFIGIMMGTVMAPDMMNQLETQTGITTPAETRMMLGQNWYLLIPAIIKAAPIFLVGLLLVLVAAFLSPMAVLNYLKNKRFGAAFEFGTIVKKAFTGQYILAWTVVSLLTLVVGAVLSVVPFLGAAIAMFVMNVIGYSLYGQIYKEV